jgi:hypothetical protein
MKKIITTISGKIFNRYKWEPTEEEPVYPIQEFYTPRRDEHGQWWWGYRKVRLIRLPEEEKTKYLEKMNATKPR